MPDCIAQSHNNRKSFYDSQSIALFLDTAMNQNMGRPPRKVTPHPKPVRFRPTFIAQWREFRGLTQAQLAQRLNMTQSHLSLLENQKRGYTQETLEAIAEALQTDVASLLIRNPLDSDAIWSIWEHAKPGERQMIIDIAKTITKTG
jgi:ribosome-binding protein aMBF1 (putative translation factor)